MDVEVTEQWSERKLSKQSGRFVASRTYFVSGVTDESHALVAGGVPQQNDAHPLNAAMLCEGPSIRQALSPTTYLVSCTYSIPPDGDHHFDDDDPLSQPMRLHWTDGSTSEAIDRDIDGNPIVDSARDGFDPPLMEQFSTLFVAVSRYQPYYDPQQAILFANAVNNAELTLSGIGTVAARQMRCQSILPSEPYDVGINETNPGIVHVTYRFEFREDWRRRVMDMGFRGNTASGKLEIHDFEGNPVSTPVRLDSRGTPFSANYQLGEQGASPVLLTIPPGAEAESATGGEAYFLIWRTKKELDFTLLGL